MKFFECIGEFLLFRWLFGHPKKNVRQRMPDENMSFWNNDDMDDLDRYLDRDDLDRYCDNDDFDCSDHDDYDSIEDFLDEQDDYDMMDDDF